MSRAVSRAATDDSQQRPTPRRLQRPRGPARPDPMQPMLSSLLSSSHRTRPHSLPSSSIMDTIPSSRASPIPTPTPSSPSTRPILDDLLFVGSPDQQSAFPSRPSRPNLPARPSRPSFRRSLSNSLSFNQRRADTISRVHELSSSFIHNSRSSQLPNNDSDDASREWSLFAQLISHDSARPEGPTPRPPDPPPQTLYASSPPALDNRTSYFNHVASNYGVHDPFESEHLQPHHRTPTPPNGISPHDDPYRSDSAENSDTASARHSDHTRRASARSTSKWYSPARLPSLSPLHRNILKCCIAYFIGSLFTFSPYLSAFIADITGQDPGDRVPSPSGHMVATM